jgi:hypothetical protein
LGRAESGGGFGLALNVEAAKMLVMRSVPESILLAAVAAVAFAACDEADAPSAGEASRSVEAVCERWLAVERGGDAASAGLGVPDVCDDVATDAAEADAALARLNASRWLAGVAEVGTLAAHQRLAERVALMMARSRSVAPVPERSWACYTEETGTAYRWTSHALGVTSVSQAVSLFVDSPDDATLSNRMWMLDPVLDGVGLARVGDAAAVYVRGYVPRPAPPFVAYPGPGPFPATWLPRSWSFAATASLEGAEVVVTEASSGLVVPFSNYLAQVGGEGSWGSLALVPEAPTPPGEYLVSVTTVGGRWAYAVRIVDCAAETL